jgi:hypothetical protein
MSDQKNRAGREAQTLEQDLAPRRDPAETQDPPSDEGYDVVKPRRAALHRRDARAQAARARRSTRTRRRDDRGDRSQALERRSTRSSTTPSSRSWRAPGAASSSSSTGGLPREHQGRDAQLSKEDLLNDFEDSPEVPKSGLYKLVYSASTAVRRQARRAIVGNYEFGPGPQDIALLQKSPSVARWRTRPSSRRPARSSSASRLLGEPAQPEGPQEPLRGAAVRQVARFRESEDARYVGLT